MVDQELIDFFKDVHGIVEATDCEYMYIWDRYHNQNGYSWVQENLGHGRTVGYMGKKPVFISLRIAHVDNKKILFYHATSDIVNWTQLIGLNSSPTLIIKLDF